LKNNLEISKQKVYKKFIEEKGYFPYRKKTNRMILHNYLWRSQWNW